MKALFVDGPAIGLVKEYPCAMHVIEMLERLPMDFSTSPDILVAAVRVVKYTPFASDHAGRWLFKVKQ